MNICQREKSKLSTNRKRASVSQVVRVVQVKAIKLPLRLAKIRASTFSAKDFPWWTHTVLVGVGNGIATLESSLVIIYKTKYTPIVQSCNCALWHLPQRVENL